MASTGSSPRPRRTGARSAKPRASAALEREAGAGAGRLILGVDEVGRGPLAGPVTAAAAWIDLDRAPDAITRLVADSKTLSPAARAAIVAAVEGEGADQADIGSETAGAPGLRVALGWASVEEIDRINILQASLLAMTRAVDALTPLLPGPPDLVLVDGNRLPAWRYPARAVIGGDGISLSIALASIVAKQARDAEMRRLAERYPGYGWERNAGYGTAEHRAALLRLGVTPAHRRSFAPVRALVQADSPA